MTIVVHAHWDADAHVWVAESDDVPGLITEAETPDGLQGKLQVLIPELWDANQCQPVGEPRVELVIHYHREDRTTLPVSA